MIDRKGNDALPSIRNRRVHMANERTFLAWIRTSIGIMAFGFVVERFALFVRQVAYFLTKAGLPETVPQTRSYASVFGIILVAFGALLVPLAYIRYRRLEQQIGQDAYEPSKALNIALTIAVFATGIFLVVYLLRSL